MIKLVPEILRKWLCRGLLKLKKWAPIPSKILLPKVILKTHRVSTFQNHIRYSSIGICYHALSFFYSCAGIKNGLMGCRFFTDASSSLKTRLEGNVFGHARGF